MLLQTVAKVLLVIKVKRVKHTVLLVQKVKKVNQAVVVIQVQVEA